jgi:hypothetical protein
MSVNAYDWSGNEICGEKMIPFADLPAVWQKIARNEVNHGLTMRNSYVNMVRLFMHKLSKGNLDLFDKRAFESGSMVETLGVLGKETLEFFGEDFLKESYPDFSELHRTYCGSERGPLVHLVLDLFTEFGYDFPASFYRVHLAPLFREELLELRPLRLTEADKANARAWDACLHGQKVFPIQMRIQSISSKHGFIWQHGCGCNHGLARLVKADEPFEYKLEGDKRAMWLLDYIWTVLYEYAYFDITPVTNYITGSLIQFD